MVTPGQALGKAQQHVHRHKHRHAMGTPPSAAMATPAKASRRSAGMSCGPEIGQVAHRQRHDQGGQAAGRHQVAQQGLVVTQAEHVKIEQQPENPHRRPVITTFSRYNRALG